jgi:mannose-1-phosphate guanylyltransferase/mannose-1-phosphate guanylyltransferase/mannose-6-phosphate isomerase
VGTTTLFEEALARCRDCGFAKPIVVTGAAHVDHVEEQLAGFDAQEIIVEPKPRQTAAAAAVAALRLPGDAVMLVCPSDHHIAAGERFAAACQSAADLASQGLLVCLAVEANEPETRFGYVRAGEPLGPAAFRIAEFVEKPDSATAAAYLQSGLFAWNSGIFAFRAADYLAELERQRPQLADTARTAVRDGHRSAPLFYPDGSAYERMEPESIDRAVMENTDRAAMVLAAIDWSDLGDWRSLKRMRKKDENGNSIRGPAEIVDCRNVLVESDGPKVRAVGLDDLVIVIDGDDILVASASRMGPTTEAG